jgi:hypothetical protein
VAGPLLAALLASGAVALRARSIAPGGDESIVQAIPDDAFYYLVLAKHFAESHVWTFDGVHPATGFHLLWAYMLAAFYHVWPDATLLRAFVFGSAVACFCHGAAAYVVARRLSQVVPSSAAVAATIMVFCVGNIPATGAFCMETPLLLLAASLTCAALVSEAPVSRGAAALLLVLGTIGSFCRTDYVVLPAAFAIAQALLVRPRSWRGMMSTRGAICLEGALVGLALLAAHTYTISGSLVQSSAATKMRWSSILGHDVRPALAALGRVLDTTLIPRSVLTAIWVACACACLAFWLARKDRVRMQLALAGSLAGVAYVFAYAHNAAATQPWYASSFAIPLLMVLTVVLASVPRGAWAVLGGTIIVAGFSQLTRHDQAQWPHQRAPMLGGQVLAQAQYPERTGAWNAGVLSYFAGGRIVNLDGLVNDDVLDFARRNELLAYLARENIQRIADFGVMIDDRMARKLGGYDSPMADDCISKVGQLDKKYELRWSGSEYGVYDVDIACLKAALEATADAVSRSN